MQLVDDLKKIFIFEYLAEKELKLLSSFSRKKTFSKGEVLFYEKDTPVNLTILLEGTLKIYKTNLKNNEIVMHRFKGVDMVAEMAVFENIPYPASASFETDGSVIEINFAKFKNEFLYNPEMTLSFFKSLSKKIKHLEDVIALNVVLDSTARIAKYLCEHEEALHMKHSQLAQYLHMTPETLSRMFKKLVTLELIQKSSNGYVITNREGLKVLFE